MEAQKLRGSMRPASLGSFGQLYMGHPHPHIHVVCAVCCAPMAPHPLLAASPASPASYIAQLRLRGTGNGNGNGEGGEEEEEEEKKKQLG